MYNEGEIVPAVDVVDPTAGRLSQIFRRVTSSMLSLAASTPTPQLVMSHDRLILTSLLKACNFFLSMSDSWLIWSYCFECYFDFGYLLYRIKLFKLCNSYLNAIGILGALSP